MKIFWSISCLVFPARSSSPEIGILRTAPHPGLGPVQEVSPGSSPPNHELRLGQDRPWGSGAACRGGRRAVCRATGQCREAGTWRDAATAAAAPPGRPCRGLGAGERTAQLRAGVAVKLAGRQAPGGSPRLHGRAPPHPPPTRSPRGARIPANHTQGLRCPGGVQWQGQGRLGPQGVGAQSPPLSAAGTQRSFRLGRPSGPREPGSRWWGGVPALGGGDPALGEWSRPTSSSPALPQTRPLYRSSPSPRNMGGGENHSPGLRGDDPSVPGRGMIPHWGGWFREIQGSGLCGNDRWSDERARHPLGRRPVWWRA